MCLGFSKKKRDIPARDPKQSWGAKGYRTLSVMTMVRFMMKRRRSRKMMMLRRKNQSQDRKAHFVRACAVETHMDVSQEQFCVEIWRKHAGPQSRNTRHVQACAVETHIDISQEQFCVENCRKNAGPLSRDTRFVRACAGERHMGISHEPFCVEIYRKNPEAPATTSIKHRALTVAVGTPQCPRCWRKNKDLKKVWLPCVITGGYITFL